MRRASRKRTALVHTTSSTPSAQSSLVPAAHSSSRTGSESAADDFSNDLPLSSIPPVTEIRLDPARKFGAAEIRSPAPEAVADRRRQLAIVIRQRIESRLVGRVRELSVRVNGNTVVLEGKCATYYTKQLAQHAALGVLEDEQLENAILVEVPR